MGVLWGVGTRIFKIRDQFSIEIAITKFKKEFFFATPFTTFLTDFLNFQTDFPNLLTDFYNFVTYFPNFLTDFHYVLTIYPNFLTDFPYIPNDSAN